MYVFLSDNMWIHLEKAVNFHSIILPMSSPKAFSMPNLVDFGLIIGVSAALSLISKVCVSLLWSHRQLFSLKPTKLSMWKRSQIARKKNHTCIFSRVLSKMSYIIFQYYKLLSSFPPEAGSHFLLQSQKDLFSIVI